LNFDSTISQDKGKKRMVCNRLKSTCNRAATRK